MKSRTWVRLFCVRRSGGDEAGLAGEGALAALQFAEGVAYHLLGEARTLAALSAHAEAVAHVAIAAAAFVDGFADLAVCHTVAQANVHAAGSIE